MFHFVMNCAFDAIGIWFVIGMVNPRWVFHKKIFQAIEPEQITPVRRNVVQWALIAVAFLFFVSVANSVIIEGKDVSPSAAPIKQDLINRLSIVVEEERAAALKTECAEHVANDLYNLRVLNSNIDKLPDNFADEEFHKVYITLIDNVQDRLKSGGCL